jgi:DNA polymerase III delta prime subunit
MVLRTEGPKERILLMGPWGVGKSTAILNIAEMMEQTNAEGTVHVVDTTYEAERNLQGQTNTEIHSVETWDEYISAVKRIREVGGPSDWLAVDRIDPVWDQAQAGYSEKAFGKDIDQWFLEYKAAGKEGHAFSGEYGTNWVAIKRMYEAFMTEVMRFKGHVIATAKAVPVQEPNRDGKGGDNPDLRAEYGKFGVRPAGEKNLGFMFHTVLLLSEVKQGEYTYTTVRDRRREQQKSRSLTGFVPSYLIGVAGWKL